jgi:hypothetical protein
MSSLDPLRIAAVPDVTLDVVVEGQLTRLRAPPISNDVTHTTVEDSPDFSITPTPIPLSQDATPLINATQPTTEEIPSGTTTDAETNTKATSSHSNGSEEIPLGSADSAETPIQQLSSGSNSTDDLNTIPLPDDNTTTPSPLAPGAENPSSNSPFLLCGRTFVIDPEEGLEDILDE